MLQPGGRASGLVGGGSRRLGWGVSVEERDSAIGFVSGGWEVLDSRATHARTLLPAALASVPFGFVLVRVRVRAVGRVKEFAMNWVAVGPGVVVLMLGQG